MDDKHVPDYFTYVDEAMDFTTIWYRLNSKEPFKFDAEVAARIRKHSLYATYGEFFSDMRLVIQNAITYNGVHRHTNVVSQKLYDKALVLKDVIEKELCYLSLLIVDRVEVLKIDNSIRLFEAVSNNHIYILC